ncbi:patatin-like phospholipase family protein [Cesiribacter andamanensis]|uniref:Patatin-like phospholipase n=1 Tax=Cesiribacter andamanensis AMV16 TaxID=1279009 RepID=M7N889_9BACT|nr:patatin-like phospholipase family protein [Cesiribacter andamanensis]EMR04793.1 Patatin-like phospholipase [Cesiribacter andamanensis AMV16]
MLRQLYQSLPLQLLIHHIRKNQILLLLWGVLFAIIFQSFGRVLGIPFLFLDPEYQGRVSFSSFFIIGLALGAFSMAYHITSYILDGPRFSFLGTLSRPFGKFCVNNCLIPILFLITYMVCIVRFQLDYEYITPTRIVLYLAGLLSGYGAILVAFFLYFRFTNKDIFLLFAEKVDHKLRRIRISRVNMAKRLQVAKTKRSSISWYLDLNLRPRQVPPNYRYYDKEAILRVFDQNHLNSVILELILLLLILGIGFFRDYPTLQLPAAASAVLLLTVVLMVAGALSFWLRSWTFTVVIVAFLVLNTTSRYAHFQNPSEAFGLDYGKAPVAYNLQVLDSLSSLQLQQEDKEATLAILTNWRNKFPLNEKPRLVLICTSGGGQRSALWTMRALQTADSLTSGGLMRHATLITGASGGMVGAAYYRELVLRQYQQQPVDPWSAEYLDRISRDNLNPIIFSLLVNDLFIKTGSFEWGGHRYQRDRGHAFEQQLNRNTQGFLDKPLAAYRQPEAEGLIPMMLIAPNITNDGRKLFISPQSMAYMSGSGLDSVVRAESKVKGVDFRRLFAGHGADSLRFISALRMSATFPYITPNQILPSEPALETMDSGIADNFGIEDGVRFLYVFRDWIGEHTAGVVVVCIRDSEKEKEIEVAIAPSLLQKFFTPLNNIYKNWTYLQDIDNDNQLEMSRSWLEVPLHRVDLQYKPRTMFADGETPNQLKEEEIERASLNWRLTTKEKRNILDNIYLPDNQQALQLLQRLLQQKEPVRLLTKSDSETASPESPSTSKLPVHPPTLPAPKVATAAPATRPLVNR